MGLVPRSRGPCRVLLRVKPSPKAPRPQNAARCPNASLLQRKGEEKLVSSTLRGSEGLNSGWRHLQAGDQSPFCFVLRGFLSTKTILAFFCRVKI